MRGFTLLELLVVVLIIGILAGFAVLSVGDGGRGQRLEQEARRLAALIELASEEAVLRAQEFGLSVTAQNYRFLVLEGDDWQPPADDEVLRARPLPEGVALELVLEGRAVELEQVDAAPAPQILLLSSGELTPFELRLRADEGRDHYRLSGHPDGRVELAYDAHAP